MGYTVFGTSRSQEVVKQMMPMVMTKNSNPVTAATPAFEPGNTQTLHLRSLPGRLPSLSRNRTEEETEVQMSRDTHQVTKSVSGRGELCTHIYLTVKLSPPYLWLHAAQYLPSDLRREGRSVVQGTGPHWAGRVLFNLSSLNWFPLASSLCSLPP